LKKTTLIFALFYFVFFLSASANDSLYIKVHFLYGSKPKREFKEIEKKWFGGKLGGHVGIEIDSNKIVDFVPHGDFHYIEHKDNFNSKFAIHNIESFWEIFGGSTESVKKLSILIPITLSQKLKLDSIANVYTLNQPYDYAFIGMRCGAASYDLLSQIGILTKYSHRKTYLKIFYPKKIRKRLLKKAQQNNWTTYRQEGTPRRKWEKD
jgi:hypothetical protein